MPNTHAASGVSRSQRALANAKATAAMIVSTLLLGVFVSLLCTTIFAVPILAAVSAVLALGIRCLSPHRSVQNGCSVLAIMMLPVMALSLALIHELNAHDLAQGMLRLNINLILAGSLSIMALLASVCGLGYLTFKGFQALFMPTGQETDTTVP